VSEYTLTERGADMKKHIACPVCGFKRLVDADEKTQSEVCEESQIKTGWRPDYYAKCKKCGKQIGIKKIE
jgi:DNA-directed RNA polymerase subunit RPC12/RpoP